MLSATAEYALRAVVYIARRGDEGPVRASELASEVDVPRNYLGKILHELVRAGVLTSSRGKHGGFRLAVPPEGLSLLEVISRFDQINGRRQCLLGGRECSEENPCPLHDRWKVAAEEIATFFRETSVANVME